SNNHLDLVDDLVAGTVKEHAARVDSQGSFPRESVDAFLASKLAGLISAPSVGGMGLGPRAAVEVVQRLAQACGSTAMIITMHYAGTAVIEKFGDEATRKAIASGKHLSTLAFSERGSRSQFWAPT